MPLFCASCGAQMPDISSFCPACGKAVPAGDATAAAPAPRRIPGALPVNVAGMLAYLLLPAAVFLFLEPYRRNRFVRFHSFQALFCAGASVVLVFGLMTMGMVPMLALLVLLASVILFFGAIILATVLLIKAFQGEFFKLPVIGDLAEKRANAL